MLTMPLAKNAIMVRLENIHDNFDGVQKVTPKFNLMETVENLYKSVNGADAKFKTEIYELDISGNMLEKEAIK